MRGLQFAETLRFADALSKPSAAENDALISVGLAGICNTDLEIVRGYKSFHGVLGHEFVGTVVDCRQRDWLGKRVVGEINVTCGRCDQCQVGRSKHCRNRAVLGISGLDGAFAEFLTLPVENLHRVPDELPDEEAVFVEPLAAAFQIVEQIHVWPGDRAAVLGDGKLGLLCAQVLAMSEARVTLLSKHESKADVARSLGLHTVIGADVSEREYDIVVEATGSPAGLQQSLELVRPRGTIVLKTTVAEPMTVDLSRAAVDEITIVGSRCGPFRRALAALSSGAVKVKPLISARFPLHEGLEAMERASEPEILKVLLEIGTP
ncbi:MAG TPA: alcohol dehydrogenase catalytic domain-containing protein [Chloroflexota bacterium]